MTTEATETDVHESEETDEKVVDADAVLKANKRLQADNRALRERIKQQDGELERLHALEDASKSEREKELDSIRADADKKAEEKYGKQLLAERVAARAARRFQDPADVVRLLDFDSFEDFEPATIDARLDELAEQKPYLLYEQNGKERKVPDADQGHRGSPPSADDKQSPDDWLLGLTGRVTKE
jgi:hypothetical protein